MSVLSLKQNRRYSILKTEILAGFVGWEPCKRENGTGPALPSRVGSICNETRHRMFTFCFLVAFSVALVVAAYEAERT